MALTRIGMTAFGVGLFVASVAAVTLGVTFGCTEVGCDGPATLALRGISLTSITVFDGCNTCELNPAVIGGLGLSLFGVVVGGVGVIGDVSGS